MNVSKPLAYLDQNVIGLQLEGKFDLSAWDQFRWVYSKEHFAEIRRSELPQKYLDVLAAADAKLLDLAMENFKLTDQCVVVHAGNPHEHFARYLEAKADVSVDEGIFDHLLAWGNGGSAPERLRQIPQRWADQLDATCRLLTPELREQIKEKMAAIDLAAVIEQVISHGNDVEKARMALGGGKGRLGDIKGPGQLRQIWEIVGEGTGRSTSEEFFGFAPNSSFGYEAQPAFLGIVACCAVLDHLGFKAERKARRADKIPNVRSDAAHIGMGAYCAALFSADRRLVERAQAIYEYRDIGTVPVLVAMDD